MLTDGQPNVGKFDIQAHVKKAIEGKYPLYNLGFGYGVDYNFLEKMALENKGLARRIYPDSDASLQLQGFYDEVSNPMLTDVELNYPENEISDLTKNSFKHFYDGSEIVVAGRFIDNNQNSLTVDVRGEGVSMDFFDLSTVHKVSECSKLYIFGEYIERLWAYLTIEQLLEERIAATGEKKENLTAEALDLSLKYKFVTPLTSMVRMDLKFASPLELHKARDYDVASLATLICSDTHRKINWFKLRERDIDGDPHFIISVPQKKDAICFNINENPGAVLNLINDPVTGITVNGELIGDKRVNSDAKIQNTYFGKLGIANKHLDLRLTVTPEKITIQNGNEKTGFTWLDSVTLQQEGLTLIINREKSLVLKMGSGASFVIVLHQVWKKHPLHQDFLGLYALESEKLSEQTHGLLGQFFHPLDFTILEIHPGSDPKKPDATMIVKNNELTVTR
uniref:Inter-alpha-trypsin inhibitor heavy chain H3 n=1 Tax=Strix occidentalis caurina TaxID=311401 RepID=A0A8D0EN65_STROC